MKEYSTINNIRSSKIWITAIGAMMILAVCGCSPEGDSQEEPEQATEPEAELTESDTDAGEQPGEDESQGPTDNDSDEPNTDEEQRSEADDSADEDESEDSAAAPEGLEDHPIFLGYESVAAEFPDSVIFEVDADDGVYEWNLLDGETEHEVDTDVADGSILAADVESGPDAEELAKIEAIDSELLDALFAAVEEHGGELGPTEAELDRRGDLVVWEVEFSDDREVYVDVASGEVVGWN